MHEVISYYHLFIVNVLSYCIFFNLHPPVNSNKLYYMTIQPVDIYMSIRVYFIICDFNLNMEDFRNSCMF